MPSIVSTYNVTLMFGGWDSKLRNECTLTELKEGVGISFSVWPLNELELRCNAWACCSPRTEAISTYPIVSFLGQSSQVTKMVEGGQIAYHLIRQIFLSSLVACLNR